MEDLKLQPCVYSLEMTDIVYIQVHHHALPPCIYRCVPVLIFRRALNYLGYFRQQIIVANCTSYWEIPIYVNTSRDFGF